MRTLCYVVLVGLLALGPILIRVAEHAAPTWLTAHPPGCPSPVVITGAMVMTLAFGALLLCYLTPARSKENR